LTTQSLLFAALDGIDQTTIAVAFLALALIAAVAFIARWWLTTGYAPIDTAIYLLALLLTRVLWRVRVPRFPLPPDQGAVIVCNHRSSVDPFFIQIVVGRYVSWMVAREFCEHIAFRWFLRRARTIPVNRSGIDTAATKMAIRLVSEGGVVGMFPEGRINRTSEFMLPGRPGAVLIALKGRVPILPCYIAGAPYRGTTWSPLLTPARVAVHFGEPIDLSPYYGREQEPGVVAAILLEVMQQIANLAGRDDFQPTLAGKKWLPAAVEMPPQE
jgi:1-acyl-sn-glycerol-3-phosphate acyltransferase